MSPIIKEKSRANDKPRKLGPLELDLLTEVQRQDYFLSLLPDEYPFPLFSGKQAVLSQRHSGYRTTARAAREIVDNSKEAGAKNVWIIFNRPSEFARAKHQRKNSVSALAFIDDGPGMRPDMARFALTWGGGTHYENPKGIGKFGFGLPNSSINQARRVEVYTKTEDDEEWSCVVLDINDLDEYGLVSVPPAQFAEMPDFVTEYIARNNIELDHGTVVVWETPMNVIAPGCVYLR